MKTIFFSNNYEGEMLDIVKSFAPEGIRLEISETGTQEECLERVRDAEYLFAGHTVRVNAEMLAAGKKLEMVQRFGVGLDTVDMNRMKELGIPLYVNRGVNSRSVAELTVLLMLALVRRLPFLDNGVHAGEWDVESVRRREIGALTVGMVGYGNIGGLVREMLRPFGTKILYWKPNRFTAAEEAEKGIEYRAFDDLLAEADIVSMHCMLNQDNKFMMNREAFGKMKDGAMFVNTSRGDLVCEDAFEEAIRSGKLSGAALDVFHCEPLEPESRLRDLPNVILTPHAGGVTRDSFTRILSMAFSNIAAFDRGDLQSIEHCRIV